MRLSDAIMLGSVLVKMKPNNWFSCALGVAGTSVGISTTLGASARAIAIKDAFPWLRTTHIDNLPGWEWDGEISFCASIWRRFDFDVCWGDMTLEQLVDYVRSIEPSCGECNRFECTCVKTKQHQTDSVQLMDKVS